VAQDKKKEDSNEDGDESFEHLEEMEEE